MPSLRGTAARISAACALVLLAAPAAGAHDSLAPRGVDYHPWLPAERWVGKHWIPYDEARLLELLRVDEAELFAWLKDDHRTLADLARRRRVDPRALTRELLAPRRDRVGPRTYARLRERTRRMLTQGHLAQHVHFHVFHGARLTRPVPRWFGIGRYRYARLRNRLGWSPREIALRHDRDPARLRTHALKALVSESRQGAGQGSTSGEQAGAMLARQVRVLDCWIDSPAPKFDPHNPFGDPDGGHGDHSRGSRVGIRNPKPARGCWRGLYSEAVRAPAAERRVPPPAARGARGSSVCELG